MIDLFCGLGGGTEGALAEGFDCIGFDLERHVYAVTESHFGGLPKTRILRYPGKLVLQDALTIHGKQCRDAAYIWASPPCQEFSYMAMPWRRAKQIAAALRGDDSGINRDDEWGAFPEGYTGSRTIAQLTALFDACFRIQREACEAADRYIPMVVENVKGAQPWVGRAKANFGSFYLWGDVAMVGNRVVASAPTFGQWTRPMRAQKFNPDGTEHPQGSWFKIADSKERGANTSRKVEGFNFHEHEKTGKPGRSFQSAAVDAGTKQHGSGPEWFDIGIAKHSSKSDSRKAASAQIAKIPFALSQYIARAYKPLAVVVSS